MKRIAIVLAVLCSSFLCFSQSQSETEINPKTGFPEITAKPFIVFNEGLAFANVTRIETQSGRNNFVWQDSMLGAFVQLQSQNMKPLNSVIRISAFYPFRYTFNDVPQIAKQTILYAFDLFAGPIIETDMWKYVSLKFSAGLHYMYQLKDEYHMHYLGGGFLTGLELPLAPRWTILLDGTFSLDYPNFGTNRLVQPFDYSWQYQINLGVRYSRRAENRYSYIRKTAMQTAKWNIQAQKRAEKAAEKEGLRAQKKAEIEARNAVKNEARMAAKKKKLSERQAEAAEELARAEEKLAEKAARKAMKKQQKQKNMDESVFKTEAGGMEN